MPSQPPSLDGRVLLTGLVMGESPRWHEREPGSCLPSTRPHRAWGGRRRTHARFSASLPDPLLIGLLGASALADCQPVGTPRLAPEPPTTARQSRSLTLT
jgi:hypothetical protein